MSKVYIAGFYLLDRVYGGPEEGGWWYNTGELVRPSKIFHNEATAMKYIDRANARLRYIQKKKRSRGIYSMAYNHDVIICELYDDKLPESWPEHTPHYE